MKSDVVVEMDSIDAAPKLSLAATNDDAPLGCVAQPNIIEAGREAWERLSTFQTYDDWMLVGEALLAGREKAMHAANCDKPKGRRYNEAFSDWLKENELDGVDKGTRSRLLKCLEHRQEIETWRVTLTTNEKLKLNHPEAILRHWQKKTHIAKPAGPSKPSRIEELTASIIDLEEEKTALKEKNARMEREIEHSGGGDLWTPEDTAQEIAISIFRKVLPAKAQKIAEELERLVWLSENPDEPNTQVH